MWTYYSKWGICQGLCFINKFFPGHIAKTTSPLKQENVRNVSTLVYTQLQISRFEYTHPTKLSFNIFATSSRGLQMDIEAKYN